MVGEEWLLEDREKEVLRKQMWVLAEYCGVEIVTYALMSNHYHIVLCVPMRREVSDAELLRNYRLLYPNMKRHQENSLAVVEQDMSTNGKIAQRWRQRQLAQMFDVSQFNKLLKMRFTIWYNKENGRSGTFWSERFKSPVIQDGDALRTISAYVELNAVRTGQVSDPIDYRFCMFAEAVAGNARARAGICRIFGTKDWQDASQCYRFLLFGTLAATREQKAPLSSAAFNEFVKTGGKLPLHAVLRCRIRYFVDGIVLGSEEFVRRKAARLTGKPRSPRPLGPVTDWGGLHVLSRMRGNVWG